MGKTSIAWADFTFNPWWGCEKISPACTHCYAEAWAKRTGHAIWGKDAPRRFFGEKHWNEPMKWERRARELGYRLRVFCASMADVFEDRSDLDEHRNRLWPLMLATPNLDWMLLTKRPKMVEQCVPENWLDGIWPRNVWLGVTAENQATADERIPLLLQTPAAVRFVSYEPALGPVRFYGNGLPCKQELMAGPLMNGGPKYLGGPFLDWIIAGFESGPGARVGHPDWARSVRDQCVAAGVPFLFKQWGEYAPIPELPTGYGCMVQAGDVVVTLDGRRAPIKRDLSCELEAQGEPMRRVGKKRAGRLLDGQEWSQFPEVLSGR